MNNLIKCAAAQRVLKLMNAGKGQNLGLDGFMRKNWSSTPTQVHTIGVRGPERSRRIGPSLDRGATQELKKLLGQGENSAGSVGGRIAGSGLEGITDAGFKHSPIKHWLGKFFSKNLRREADGITRNKALARQATRRWKQMDDSKSYN